MKYKVGDRVRILKRRTVNFNPLGGMDKWLGRTMTIRRAESGAYRMMEDIGDGRGDGWIWCEDMIEGLAEETHTLLDEIKKYHEMAVKMNLAGVREVDANADTVRVDSEVYTSLFGETEIMPFSPNFNQMYTCIGRLKIWTMVEKNEQ